MIVTLELRANKWYKLSYFTTFILLNEWIMLILLRVHYLIDTITGVIMAHYIHIGSERLSYYVDVLLLEIPWNQRIYNNYAPC